MRLHLIINGLWLTTIAELWFSGRILCEGQQHDYVIAWFTLFPLGESSIKRLCRIISYAIYSRGAGIVPFMLDLLAARTIRRQEPWPDSNQSLYQILQYHWHEIKLAINMWLHQRLTLNPHYMLHMLDVRMGNPPLEVRRYGHSTLFNTAFQSVPVARPPLYQPFMRHNVSIITAEGIWSHWLRSPRYFT